MSTQTDVKPIARPKAVQAAKERKKKEPRKEDAEEESSDYIISHPYINLRRRVAQAAAADATDGGAGDVPQEAEGQQNPPQQELPPPQDDRPPGGDPDHPLQWPDEGQDWTWNNLASHNGLHLNMNVKEVYNGMGRRFFELYIPRDTNGRPYRGPREWLAKYDAAQEEYLRGLVDLLYEGGSQDGVNPETVRRLWPECPRQDHFVCPFCFAARRQQMNKLTYIHNLHTHVLTLAEKEADEFPINSPERIHDPAIFHYWGLYRNRPVSRNVHDNGKCNWCDIRFTNDTRNHLTARFYCKTRNEAKRIWDDQHPRARPQRPPRPAPQAQAPAATPQQERERTPPEPIDAAQAVTPTSGQIAMQQSTQEASQE